MAETKGPPSATMYEECEEQLREGKLDLSSMVKRGAQYLLQCAIEYEVREMLGRGYYRHATPEQREEGRLSGYENRRVLTAEGAVEVKLPQVRDGK